MEIRICVQKIHEKHHGTPHVPRGFHIPQKILRFSASAKAAQRTQMDMALLLDAGSTATKIWSSLKSWLKLGVNRLKKSGW